MIKPYVAQRCEDCDYPVLSITRHQGLILQSDRFKKEIASRDKSQYKVIPRNVLVVAFPIDEGLLCAQQIVDNGLVSPAYKTYKIDEKIVFPRILELILRSDKSISYYLSKMRGTTLRRRTLPEEEFQSMLIDLPSMSMQKHFIKMLEQIDVVKIICKQIFQLFDDLVKSRFIEMFGAVDNPKVPFEQLGNIATYVNGYAFKPSDWGTEGLPIIRIQNLSGSGDSFNYYSGTYPPAIEINKGDIMISWSATLGVFVWDGPKALLNQHIFKVYFDKLEVNPTYFRVAVEPALERSASKVHGSTMTHLTKKTFDSIMVPLPSINQQNKFASFVHQVDKSKFVETVEPDHPAVFQNIHGFPSFGLIST